MFEIGHLFRQSFAILLCFIQSNDEFGAIALEIVHDLSEVETLILTMDNSELRGITHLMVLLQCNLGLEGHLLLRILLSELAVDNIGY